MAGKTRCSHTTTNKKGEKIQCERKTKVRLIMINEEREGKLYGRLIKYDRLCSTHIKSICNK